MPTSHSISMLSCSAGSVMARSLQRSSCPLLIFSGPHESAGSRALQLPRWPRRPVFWPAPITFRRVGGSGRLIAPDARAIEHRRKGVKNLAHLRRLVGKHLRRIHVVDHRRVIRLEDQEIAAFGFGAV